MINKVSEFINNKAQDEEPIYKLSPAAENTLCRIRKRWILLLQ
jgi:hypothetical protein